MDMSDERRPRYAAVEHGVTGPGNFAYPVGDTPKWAKQRAAALFPPARGTMIVIYDTTAPNPCKPIFRRLVGTTIWTPAS